MMFNIHRLGISIIWTYDEKRVELVYATIEKLEFLLLDKETELEAQLRFKYLNIDNNFK